MLKKQSTDSTNTLTISEELNGERIDKALSTLFENHSRAYFQSLIENGAVFINGKVAIKRHKVQIGDLVEYTLKVEQPSTLTPQDIPLDILFEDDHIIAINKPAGMVVHPAPGHPDKTFVNALLFHCKNLEQEEGSVRPGIVHRLDKDTSGVMIAAKTRQVHALLTELFSSRQIEKEYIAICVGLPKALSAFGKIARHQHRRQEMCLTQDRGKAAESHFEILGRDDFVSLVKAMPKTGRTHQIRVHLRSLGAPILGDKLYSKANLDEKYGVMRQCLHAHKLRFVHPITGEKIVLEAPIPQDMARISPDSE